MIYNDIKQLSVRTRAILISDAFSFTEANFAINQTLAFKLAMYLHDEFDYLPWTVFISRIKFFTDLYESTSSYDKLQTYLSYLVTPYYSKLGWIENVKNDNWTDRQDLRFF